MNQPQSHRSRTSVWLGAIFLVAAIGVTILIGKWGSKRGQEPESGQGVAQPERKTARHEKPAPPRSDFIGSAACAECHSQIAELYNAHSMSKSMFEAASAPVVEDYAARTSFSPDAHHTYSVERTPEGVFHHEKLTDNQGDEIYDQAVRVDYALGSGHQGRSYLIDRGGLMFMSPITWYSHASRWDLSPQYRLPTHRRFERRILDECLDCHTGRVNSVRNTENRFQSPPFLELSIGCERCHGPGGEHASLHRQGLVELGRDPIVNPSKLEPAFREDICAQCHLQGEGSYPRYGCDVGDFRPGQRLEQTRTIFVAGTRTKGDGTTRAVSHVEQMRASRCFQMSDGRFGCSSCHDAHGRPYESRVAFYLEKCQACHNDKPCSLPEPDRLARQADNSCIACHMPRLGANDVPHTAQTDHRVLRKPTTDSQVSPPLLPDFYDNADQRLPKLDVDYARGLWLADKAERRRDPEMANRAFLLLSTVENELSDDVRLLNALGKASAALGRSDDALAYWHRALEIDPRRESTLESITMVLNNSGRFKEGRQHLERLLELNPWRSSLWGQYARLLGHEKNWDQAIVAAKKSLELDPSAPPTYLFLAEACQQIGDTEQSQHYRDLFQRIQRVRP